MLHPALSALPPMHSGWPLLCLSDPYNVKTIVNKGVFLWLGKYVYMSSDSFQWLQVCHSLRN